jgi:hypothetical protein
MKTVDMGQIKFKELAVAIKVLNDSGLLAEKIPTVGKSKDKLVDAFILGVQGIPDDPKTGDWTGPVDAAKYYQEIVITDSPATDSSAPVTTKHHDKQKSAPGVTKEKKSRIDVATEVIAAIKDSVLVSDLVDKVGKGYLSSGGKDNPNDTKAYLKMALTVAEKLGYIQVVEGLVTKL